MKLTAEIICVGTELLLGDIVNTNAEYISRALAAIGVDVFYQEVVGDNAERLRGVLSQALSRSDIIITSGGLGPTYDDLTKETVADIMGLSLVRDADTEAAILEFFRKRGIKMTDNNMKQALVPEGCRVLKNSCGTAPGICIENKDKTVVLLPGPPRELTALLDEQVIPLLRAKSPGRVLLSKNINVYGMGESAVEDALRELMLGSTNPTLAPYAKDGEVLLRVTASAQTEQAAENMVDDMIQSVRGIIGDYIYGIDCGSLQNALVTKLRRLGKTVSTAESCTGGLVSKRITEISGASEVFGCGICSYSCETKEKVLGVRRETLEKYTAVSAQTAAEMAEGVRRLSGSDIAVSVTGYAGPTGGTPEDPVGTVYIGVATEYSVHAERHTFGRNAAEREYVRYLAASAAISAAIKALDE